MYEFLMRSALVLLLLSSFLQAEELSLSDCISLSLKESEQVQASEAGKDVASSGKNSLIFKFFPSTKVEAGYQWLTFKPEPAPASFGGFEMNIPLPDKSRTFNVTIVQPITPLWSVFNGYKAASLGTDIASLKAELTQNQIRMEVINLYYNYQMLTETLEILNVSNEQLDRYHKQAKNFLDVGITDKRAVLKMDIEISQLKHQIISVKGNIKLLKKNLALFMNRAADSFTLKVENVPDVSLSVAGAELSSLMRDFRPDLKILEKSSQIANYMESSAIQPFIPSFALISGYQRNWDTSSFQPEGTIFFGGRISWNVLFDWGSAFFDYNKAKSERIKTELENIAATKQMKVQLIKLENSIETAWQSIKVAKSEILSAKENLRIEEDKYRQQLTTETDLLAASVTLKSAQMKLLRARYEHEMALNKLAATLGVPYEKIISEGGGYVR